MAQDDPAAGIRDWEEKFWSMGGLLDKKLPKKSAAKQDNSWLVEQQREALASFRRKQEQDSKRKPAKKPARKRSAAKKMAK